MIDLHCHSACSDGTDAPDRLASMADALGIEALALTDHDTLDGLAAFLGMQSQVHTRLVPGIELSCRFLGMELHLLGLFLDPQNARLQERVHHLQERRHERNRNMAQRLRAMGISITLEDVTRFSPSHLVSRAHFAKALVHRGDAGSRQDAFARFIGDGRPAHVPFETLTVQEACSWIKEADGVPVLAHPGRSANRGFRWEEALVDLKAVGVEGLEAVYSDYGPREEAYFTDLARQLELAPSGGSDYHGEMKPGLSLGTGRGGMLVPDSFLAELEARKPSCR